MKIPNVYSMELHDVITIDSFTSVRRVPGGWIYDTSGNDDVASSTVFVPVSLEFDPTRDPTRSNRPG